MIFYDSTKKLGICQAVDFRCDSDDTSYPVLDKRREYNSAGESLVAEIINADGTFQWDDTNQTDQPRGKGTLTEGREAYTYESEYLQIEGMDILDLDGITYKKIKPIDYTELGGVSPDEYFGLETDGNPKKGIPQYYDLFADDSFRLYPAPGAAYCTLTNGYRVWFKRTFKILDSTTLSDDYTATPGIPSPWHLLLAFMISMPYCKIYKKDRVPQLQIDIDVEKKKLLKHYASKEKERRNIITTKPISSI